MKRIGMYGIALSLACLVLFSCGGGGGGGGGGASSAGTAPVINIVRLFSDQNMTHEIDTATVGQQVWLSISLTDPDLDAATLIISQYLGDALYYGPDELDLPSQPSETTIFYLIQPVTVSGPAGGWRVVSQVEDEEGHLSNEFEIHVLVTDADNRSESEAHGFVFPPSPEFKPVISANQ